MEFKVYQMCKMSSFTLGLLFFYCIYYCRKLFRFFFRENTLVIFRGQFCISCTKEITQPFKLPVFQSAKFFCAKDLSFVKDSLFAPYSPAISATWALLLMISGVLCQRLAGQVFHSKLHLVWSLFLL